MPVSQKSVSFSFFENIPYRLDMYEPLNRMSSQIVRVEAASGLAQEIQIVVPPKDKIKNSTSSVNSRLYGKFKFPKMFTQPLQITAQ